MLKDTAEKRHQERFYSGSAGIILGSHLMRLRRRYVIAGLARALENPGSASVLSLGCGNGANEFQSVEYFGNIVGLDISETAIAQANGQKESLGIRNVEFVAGDCTDLSAVGLPAPFDAIWALGFLHHIGDEAMLKLIGEAYTLLKPGGVMISLDPSTRRIVGIFKRLVKGKIATHHSPDEHELDPSWLKKQYANAGFRDVSIDYMDFFCGPFAWVFPRHPHALAKLLWSADRVLTACPLIRNYSSSFRIVGGKEVML